MLPETTWTHSLFQTLSPVDSGRDYSLIEKIEIIAGKILHLPIALVGCAMESIALIYQKWVTKKEGFEKIAEDTALWNGVDLTKINLTSIGRFGVATSHYQYGGSEVYPDSIWNSNKVPEGSDKSLAELTRGGVDIYDDIQKVIDSLRSAGMNTFRCSVPESLFIEGGALPEMEAAEFKAKLVALKEAGISVTLTLHHFSHPKFFEEAGGFFEQENRELFARWAGAIASEFGEYVDEWCTINEPGVFAVSSYFRGVFPPCEIDYKKMGQLMIGLIKTHKMTYEAIKKARPDAVVGFSQQMINFQSQSDINPVTQGVCHVMTHIFSTALLRFYESGVFEIDIPFVLSMRYVDEEFDASCRYLDIIQLQCYTRPLIGMFTEMGPVGSTRYAHEEMTNMPFREDPAAIYVALKQVAQVTQRPVSITEFGISTRKEGQRKRYFERALYAISEAIKEGVEVRSLHAWAFHGSGDAGAYHEWNEDPDEQNFGIFKYNPEPGPHEHTVAIPVLQRAFVHLAAAVAAGAESREVA